MNPRFVVINPGFEGADAQPLRWLGRVVAQMDTPAAKYAPFEADMRPLLSRFVLRPTQDLNAVAFAEAIGDKTLQFDFMNWIHMTSGTTDKKALEIHSPRITTFSLQQHDAFLEALHQQGKGEGAPGGPVTPVDEVLRLLRASDRKAYLVVGVKILYNAIISLASDGRARRQVGLTLPVVEAAMLATGAPLGALLAANPHASASTGSQSSNDIVYTFERPRIFALEYREVTYNKSFFRRLSGSLKLSMQAPARKKGHYVFAPTGPEKNMGKQPTAQKPEDESAKDEEAENEVLLVKATAISLADINEEVDWSTSTVDISGRESESCVLVHELKEVQSEDSEC